MFSPKMYKKLFKKEDVINDEGVRQRGNHIDAIIIIGCTAIAVALVYLTIMAYVAS